MKTKGDHARYSARECSQGSRWRVPPLGYEANSARYRVRGTALAALLMAVAALLLTFTHYYGSQTGRISWVRHVRIWYYLPTLTCPVLLFPSAHSRRFQFRGQVLH